MSLSIHFPAKHIASLSLELSSLEYETLFLNSTNFVSVINER